MPRRALAFFLTTAVCAVVLAVAEVLPVPQALAGAAARWWLW